MQLASSERLKNLVAILLGVMPVVAGAFILALLYLHFKSSDIETLGDYFFHISFLLFASFTAVAALVNFDREGKKTVYASYSILYASLALQPFFFFMLFWNGVLLPQETLDKNNCTERSPSLRETQYCIDLLEEKGMEIQSHLALLGAGLTGWVASLLFFILRVQHSIL